MHPQQPTASPTAVPRFLVVLALVLAVLGYGLAVFASRSIWQSRDATRLTFATRTLDGSPPTPDALAAAVNVVQRRLDGLKVSGAAVTADGTNVVATVPAGGPDVVPDITRMGQLTVRPVIHAMPAQSGSAPANPTAPPKPADPARSADEKQLRQSTNPSIQILALQFQATRCGDEDQLAGHDDPKLPLVTCSTDGKSVYLLDKSILTGANVRRATSHWDDRNGQHVVDLEFDDSGARTWAEFTAADIGTQTAFTLDTRVVSAPEIREAIPGGRTQISGGFTADASRELAGTLQAGMLPVVLILDSSQPATLTATRFSTLMRVPIIIAGVDLLAVIVVATVWLTRRRATPQV
ncbi:MULTISPECIES: SecDF P1 head subdomain-containing protein [unclassified Mycolicibacterium]|uniref:SecDF P1 head subdomain-containing protein n=1 Tax=unclassified Mycolicibacterium TaxID=2636767 RepID=UPI002ED93B3E